MDTPTFTGDENERHIEVEWEVPCPLGVEWRTRLRTILNKAIRRFNQFNEEGCPPSQLGVIKAHLAMARRETRGDHGGDLGYDDTLDVMAAFLDARIELID